MRNPLLKTFAFLFFGVCQAAMCQIEAFVCNCKSIHKNNASAFVFCFLQTESLLIFRWNILYKFAVNNYKS